jgi:predicted enzyme related to lactoylglutathione lyase
MSSLHTTDGDGAKASYGSVFGWKPEAFGSPETPMTLWRLPGCVGGEG